MGAAATAQLRARLHAFEADDASLTAFFPVPCDEQRTWRRARIDAFEREVAAFADETLDRDGRVDHHLITADLARLRTRLQWEEQDLAAAAPLLPFLDAVIALERLDRDAGLETPRDPVGALASAQNRHGSGDARARRPDGRAVAASLDAIVRAAQAVHGATAAEAPAVAAACTNALAVRAALRATRAAQSFLDDWQRREAPADPDLGFWVTTPAKAATQALGELAAWLDGDVLAGLKKDATRNAFAIGRDRFVAELRFEGITLSPEEMLAFGQKELAALQDEIRREAVRHVELAQRGAAAGGATPPLVVLPAGTPITWQTGLEFEKQEQNAVGMQKSFVYDVGCEAVRFCVDHELFPVPALADTCWRLRLSDVDTQRTYAYGFYGGNFMGVAAPVAEMETLRKLECLRSNARPTTRTVVPHELIPGHHLQAWFAQRSAPQRERFASPFYGEGWAVHCERTLDEHGFFTTPTERIGHLFWRLLRAARIVVSTRYHLNQMTAAQMVDFMVSDAGLERSAAQAEVDRYMTYSPLYQCAYLYGCQQLRDLREECRVAWGAGFSELRFNTQVLEQGSIPIVFVREALLATR